MHATRAKSLPVFNIVTIIVALSLIALLIALATSTFLYVAVQYIVIHTLPTATSAAKPVADAAQQCQASVIRKCRFAEA
jgi:hypothetical protein